MPSLARRYDPCGPVARKEGEYPYFSYRRSGRKLEPGEGNFGKILSALTGRKPGRQMAQGGDSGRI